MLPRKKVRLAQGTQQIIQRFPETLKYHSITHYHSTQNTQHFYSQPSKVTSAHQNPAGNSMLNSSPMGPTSLLN